MLQDLGDPETFALATAAWAISIELERAAEPHAWRLNLCRFRWVITAAQPRPFQPWLLRLPYARS